MMDLGLTLGDHCSKAAHLPGALSLTWCGQERLKCTFQRCYSRDSQTRSKIKHDTSKGRRATGRNRAALQSPNAGTQRLLPAQGSAAIRIPAQSTGDESSGTM